MHHHSSDKKMRQKRQKNAKKDAIGMCYKGRGKETEAYKTTFPAGRYLYPGKSGNWRVA